MNANHNWRPSCWLFLLLVFGPGSFLSVCAAETNRLYTLSQILSRWQEVPVSEVTAIAEKGDLTAQHYLGYYHMMGIGGVTNQTEGVRWYRLAAEKEFPNSQNNLGLAYRFGQGVKRSCTTAVGLFESAARQGFLPALLNLSQMMRNDEYPGEKYDELRKMFEQLAYSGDPKVQMQLGHFLLDMPGKVLEFKNAIYWYKKAFAQGRRDACYYIGYSYQRLHDGDSLAPLWYQRGADLGDDSSKAALAWMLLTDKTVKQGVQKALMIFSDLAEKGHRGAMFTMGRFYADENLPVLSPLPRDMAQALVWYRKAAEKEHTAAMEMLGQHLLEGSSSIENEREGVKWLIKAEATGTWSAKKRLAGLALKRPELVPDGWGKIEEVALGGYAEFMSAMARRCGQGVAMPRDDLQAAFWTLEASFRSYDNPWGDVKGIDGNGRLRPQAKVTDLEFAAVYLSLVKALREQQTVFFKAAAQDFEKGEGGRVQNLVFAAVCYEQAGIYGDGEAKKHAESLRTQLDLPELAKFKRWLNWLSAAASKLKREEQK